MKPLDCLICDERFVYENFFRHKSDRLMSKPLSCIICDERFVDKTLLWPKKIWAHERMKPLDCMI